MTIQPQARQKSPIMPTLIGGGVGATAGYFGTEWYNKAKGAMSYEELIANVKDKTDFSSKKEPAKWSDFKAKAEKIASLEKQIAEVPEKVLPETDPLAIAKKDAQTAFDNRLAQMIEAEEAKLGKTVGGKLALRNEIGNALSANDVTLINSELTRYHNAVDSLRGKGGGTAVRTEFQAIDTATTSARNLFNAKNRALKSGAENIADSILVNKGTLKGRPFAEIQKLAQEFGNVYSISSEAVSGGNVFKVNDAFGTGKHAWVSVDNGALKEAKKEMVNSIKENARQYKTIENELKDIATNFLRDHQAELKEIGITDTSGLSNFKINKGFRKDILNLRDTIAMAERNGTATISIKDPISGSTGSYNINRAKDLLEQAEKKVDLVTEYSKLTGPKKAAQNALVASHPPVANARRVYQEAIANNTELKNAVEALKTKLTGKRAVAGGQEIWAKLQPLIEAEVSATGTVDKAALEKLLQEQQIGKDLKTAIEKYEKALSEKGVSNTAAKEALQKELGTVKGEAEKIAKELAPKKLPKGWVALGVGAALAVAGFMYGNNKS